ncbi:hypothetical protein DL93DRAFT_2031535, partial [Clavulina sp. PMI_390]
LVYLSPYSPDFNPIEESFSTLKAHIRRHGIEFRGFVRQGVSHEIEAWLYHAYDLAVSRRKVQGWFR